MYCPGCGAPAPDAARFCPRCGHALADAASAGAAGPTTAGTTPAAATDSARAGDRPLRPSPPHAGPAADDDRDAVTRPPSDRDRQPSSAGGWLTSSDSISHGRFPPGAILDGRYRVIALLGKGGMGEVYRADDLRLGQPVALKFLPDRVADDPARLAQFHNEVRTARQVSHPNICRVYDIGEIDRHLYLSMEFVAGEDLATSLRRIGRFPEDKALEIARQLCAGLAAAHERGVVHRDLKPANVMLDDRGKVRLMDFGLAAAGAIDNARAGTPGYMAPEQLFGREVTARSDLYALGLVLYELFTGRRAFTATTINELVEQHQSGTPTPPRTIVASIDPAIERAILRCLDPDPARRPSSALAVSAALPGGDPLAAALAAGETPSPEMVAAAGQGAGLSRGAAAAVFVLAIAGVAASYAVTVRTSPLERMRLELNADVLAQRARDAARQLGYVDRPVDEAYGFEWDDDLIDHVRAKASPATWTEARDQRPSPLAFWYRRSASPMVGQLFHHDLLTPGIVTHDDPPPIESGMVRMTLDHHGRLTAFEAIPPEVESQPVAAAPVDWTPLFALAGLDAAALERAEPQWRWLAASDTRAAWTGTWPGGASPLRVEAAALGGRPVAFQMIGPWTRQWRSSDPGTGGETAVLVVVFLITMSILIGAVSLARRNLRDGRGDQRGALALATAIGIALWALWLCQVHVSAAPGMLGIALLAVCTTSFYAVLFWTIYLALEPFVRRHWPQTLMSWTTLLGGRVRDAIVGRDVLVGVAVGVAVAVFIRVIDVVADNHSWIPTGFLLGPRGTAGDLLMRGVYAVRTALLIFFLLVLLRVVLRNQWAAALALLTIFSMLNALESQRPLIDALATFFYIGLLAFAVLRWGLTTLAVSVLSSELLLVTPATTDFSAWYAGVAMMTTAIPVALAVWGFRTAVSGPAARANGGNPPLV